MKIVAKESVEHSANPSEIFDRRNCVSVDGRRCVCFGGRGIQHVYDIL